MAHFDRDFQLSAKRRLPWRDRRHLRPARFHERGVILYTVIGSGFGLYGYLPALIETFDEFVILPESYRPKVAARPELAKYLPRIRWSSTQATALRAATGAVLALPPNLQREMVSRCCARSNLKVLFLEKPIAVSPLDAIAVVEKIRQSRTRFRVGYTFLYSDWFDRIEFPTTNASHHTLAITWRFMAHHFANGLTNWKEKHSEGGGALRFFAIHLIAVLASRGYSDAGRSVLSGTTVDCPERWEAAFSGAGLPRARVFVDTRASTTRFEVRVESGGASTSLVDLPDPFPIAKSAGGGDPRVSVLKRLLASIAAPDESHDSLCDHVNMLWLKAEAITEFAYARGTATAH